MRRSDPLEDESFVGKIRQTPGMYIALLGTVSGLALPFVLLLWIAPGWKGGWFPVALLARFEGVIYVLMHLAYGAAIFRRLGREVHAHFDEDDSPTNPYLFRVEILALVFVVVGFALAMFYFGPAMNGRCSSPGAEDVPNCANRPYDPAKFSPAAELHLGYTPLGWQLGSTLFYLSAPLLAVARFSEVFAFTGDRGSNHREYLRNR